MGKLGKTKWIRLKEKYQSNKRVLKETSEPYLYGSFYSNPAIVCNYLIRIDPFSKLHYELQSNHFDVADRLFFSVPEQLHSCLNN